MNMKALIAVMAGGLIAGCAIAEDYFREPERGRLSDGRAFRTDGQGTQLVDYIAELELNAEELSRRVGGLEDEVKEKQAVIDRLQRGQTSKGVLEERDIAAAKGAGGERLADKEIYRRDVRDTASVRLVVSGDCAALAAQTNQDLELMRTDLELEQLKRVQETESLKVALAGLQADISLKNSQVDDLQQKLLASQQEREDLQMTLRTALEQREKAMHDQEGVPMASLDRAAFAEKGPPAAIGAPAGLSRADSLSLARDRAVQSVRSKILTDINKLKSLIAARDKQFERYSQAKRSVAFKPSKAVSSNNRNLDEISAAAQTASSVYELSRLGREISEIENKIQDDIALMQRMQKIG